MYLKALRVALLIRYTLGILLGRKIAPRDARIGNGVWIAPTAFLDMIFNGQLITIHDNATITHDVKIICHDASSNRRIGATRVAPVEIGERAYLGVSSIILPGVRIGADAIVAAGAVVTKDVEAGTIVAGVPARMIGTTKDIDSRRLEEMTRFSVLESSVYGRAGISGEHEKFVMGIVEKDRALFLARPDIVRRHSFSESQEKND